MTKHQSREQLRHCHCTRIVFHTYEQMVKEKNLQTIKVAVRSVSESRRKNNKFSFLKENTERTRSKADRARTSIPRNAAIILFSVLIAKR